MNNLRKRLLSLFLSGVMTLSMAPAFAAFAEEITEGPDTAVSAEEQPVSQDKTEQNSAPESAFEDAEAQPEETPAEENAADGEAEPPAAGAAEPETDGQADAQGETGAEPAAEPEKSVQVLAAGPVKVGDAYYATLADAVSAAPAGATVELLESVQLGASVTINKNLTIAAADGVTATVSRADGFTGALFVQTAGVLTLGGAASSGAGALVLDGGANWVVDQVVTDSEGRAVLNEQGEEQTETVAADSPAVQDAYDAKAASGAALISVTAGELYIQETATLQNNHSSADGAAVATTAGGNAKIHLYGKFLNNATDGNGGVFSGNCFLTVYENAVFTGNAAQGDGGAVYLYGGGVVNSIKGAFTGNAAGRNGGALWLDGKSLIEDGTFTDNRAAAGGALYSSATYESRGVRITGGTFTGNEAATGADAVLAPDGSSSDFGWTTVSGGVTIGDAYLASGTCLAVAGALSGSIGLTLGGTLTAGRNVSWGISGYTLAAADVQHMTLNSGAFVLTFAGNTAKLQKLPDITITAQPQSFENIGLGDSAALTVTTSLSGVSYQWYSCADANGTGAQAIAGATSNTYDAPTNAVGQTYYYCVLKASGYSETKTDVVLVKVMDKSAAAPVLITKQPQGGEWGIGKEAALTVEAEADGGSESSQLSYQWYVSDSESGPFTAVENGTETALNISTDAAGERWYYCVVTNTEEDKNPSTATAQTDTVKVRVFEADAYFNGTPYATVDAAVTAMNASSASSKELVITRDATLSKAITLSSGALTISAESGVTVTRASGFKGVMLQVSGGTLTVENVKFDGNAAWSGSAHQYLGRGTSTQNDVSSPILTMTNGAVTLGEGSALQNNSNPSGAGAVNMTRGTLTLDGGSLLNCYGGSHGGALYATGSNSKIVILDGEVAGNQAGSSSGGLCVDSNASLTISGGSIHNNYTRGRAGGLFVNGPFTMTGGAITANRADGSNGNGGGGGVVHNGGAFTLSGGEITSNSTGTTGGGIASFAGALTIAGGSVTGNTAKNGGGVYKNTQQNSGSLTVSGGSVTGNTGDFDVVVTDAVALGDVIDPQYMGTTSFAHTFTVRFDGNGAPSPDSVTLHFLEKFGDSLPEAPVRNGHVFAGWFTQAEGGVEVTADSPMTFRGGETLYAHWTDNTTATIKLSGVSGSGTYTMEDSPALSLTAAGTTNLTYQWYVCDDAEGVGARAVEDGTSDTLALPTGQTALGMYYYYCVVSGDGAADVKTDVITVRLVSNVYSMIPQITQQPDGADLFVGEDVALEAHAAVVDDGSISYQWFRADDAESSGEPVDGATKAEYCFPAAEAGEGYYYVVATNLSEGRAPGVAMSARAHVVVHNRITVSDVAATDAVMSADYWRNHRVGLAESADGYITEATSRHGYWSASSTVDKAFDGDWDTFWETSVAANDNCLEMTFDKAITLDRILYSARRTQQGKGYPTRLTVSGIYAGESEYREIGVAVSDIKTGYVLFTLPQSVTLTALRFEFSESNSPTAGWSNWASAAELVLLRDEATVIGGTAELSGIAAPGAELTVTAVPDEGKTVEHWAYQWQSSADGKTFTDIEGATGATYTVQEADRDLYLRAAVRDASGAYAGSLLSDVYRGMFEASVEGEAAVGGTVNAALEYAKGEDLALSYQWQMCDTADGTFTDIGGEIQPMLTIPAAATNQYLRVSVSVTPDGGATSTAVSEPVKVSVTALMYRPPEVGVTLYTGLLGSSDEDYTCQWQRGTSETDGFTNIEGATEHTYTLTSDDQNKYIRVKVTTGGIELVSEAWLVYASGTFPQSLVNFNDEVLYISDMDDAYCFITNGGDGRPLRKDKNFEGGNLALRVDGQIKYYLKGFGGLSTSSFVYRVDYFVKYYHLNRFIARVGVDAVQDYDGNTDGVVFTTSVSSYPGGSITWTTLDQTPVLRKTSESELVDVMLPGDLTHLRIRTTLSGKSKYVYTNMADAKLVPADYKEKSADQEVFLTVEEYDLRIQELVDSHKGMTYEQMLDEDTELRKLVYQRALVNNASYSLLEALMNTEDTAKTLEWLFNDQEALELFIGGGEPDGAYGRAIQALANLYLNRGNDLTEANVNHELYLRMMMALALTHSTDIYFWVDISQVSNFENVVERYDIYKRMHANGLLVKAFETLNVEEMRMVMNNIIDNNEIEWLNWYNRKTNYKTVDPKAVEITPNNIKADPYTYIRYTYGYNYSRPEYTAPENKDKWQKEYGLTYETMPEEYKHPAYSNVNVLYEKGHAKLWSVFIEGAVCGGISKTGTNLLGAFGIPGGVVGQPGHAAYLRYVYTDEANGIARYDIYNDISGFPESARGERMPCGWGGQSWVSSDRVSYINMSQDALNAEDAYYTAQRLNLLADSFDDENGRAKQADIYEEALGVQSYHFDTWLDIVSLYEKENRSSEDFLALAGRISTALAYYPLPMYDTLENLIKPHLSGSVQLSALTAYESAALRTAKTATTANTSNATAAIRMANFLMGNHDFEVATFSFDGDNAGAIVLSNMFAEGGNELLYSLNGGKDWTNAGRVNEVQLTDTQIASITADTDILVRLQGTDNYYTIDITVPTATPKVNVNNNEQRLVSTSTSLEWKTEGMESWKPFSQQERFADGTKVTVREAAHGTQLPGPEQTLVIGASSGTKERQYIFLDNVELVGYSSAEDNKAGAAAHCIDGNIDTIWHTAWSGSDSERYVTLKLKDGPHYLNGLDYLPSQGSSANGRILKCEVYTSMTGEEGDWVLSGTVNWANNASKKTMSFTPVYAQYVKIVAVQGVNNFAAASMFELFEDTTVTDSTVTAVELIAAPAKTEYYVGEELDTTGMEVTATFKNKDGVETSGPLNLSRLQFSPTLMTKEGAQTVTATVPDTTLSVSFEVTVLENEKNPASLTVTQTPDKTRYFDGEELDTNGAVVTATYGDGTTARVFDSASGLDLGVTWNPTQLAAGATAGTQDITATYMGVTATFPVEVSPKVASIEVTALPTTTFYSLGDAFDSAGLVISAVYANGEKDALNIADYAVSASDFTTAGTKTLTVTYNRTEGLTEGGSAETTFTVTVYPYITADGLLYEALDDKYECYVTGVEAGYTPENGVVTIPRTVTAAGHEFTVTGIGVSSADGTGAFSGREDIERVTLPGTITTIEDGAFADCKSFKSINLTSFGSDFSKLSVSANAFRSKDLALTGMIYVQDEDAKMALEAAIDAENTRLPGFAGFTVVSIADAVTEFTLESRPDKTDYHLGETFDAAGLRFTAKLEDHSIVDIPENLYELSGFDPMKAGEQTITAKLLTSNDTYPDGTEFKQTFTVTVTPATPVIRLQPVGAAYALSDLSAVQPLTAAADIGDAGTLTWQWYFSENATGEGAIALENATGPEYTPTPDKSGYYYALATNSDAYNTTETAVSTQTRIVQVVFGDFEASVDGTFYNTLAEAVAAAGDGGTVELIKDVTLGSNITTSKTLTLTGHSVTRAAGFGDVLFTVKGGKLTFENIILDGGAVWSEASQDKVLGRGTANSGVTAQQPLLLVTGGEAVIARGAALQNNENKSNNYGKSGGAARVSGGTLRIAGGAIRNNYCIPFGGAVLSTGGAVVLESGSVTGNHGTSSGGVFCVDGSSSFTMKGGTVASNRGGGQGGVVWLSNGKATLSGGAITNNASGTGTIYTAGNGTVEIGAVTISGNTANTAPGVHANGGTLKLTAAPTLTDGIYLPANRTISIEYDLTGAQHIPVTVPSLGADGTVIANAQSEAQASAAAGVLTMAKRGVYADGLTVRYQTVASFTVVKELASEASVVAGQPLELTYEVTADIGNVQYTWYRCENAAGANPALLASQTGPALNIGDCNAGAYYFYCVATSDGGAGSIQSQICTVTVTPFVPAAAAIAKFNALG